MLHENGHDHIDEHELSHENENDKIDGRQNRRQTHVGRRCARVVLTQQILSQSVLFCHDVVLNQYCIYTYVIIEFIYFHDAVPVVAGGDSE